MEANHELVNYYNVLNVDPRASRVELREAYLRLKTTYSAGSAALYSLISEDEAQSQLAKVEEAFRVLGDEVARRDYDRRFLGGAVADRGAPVHMADFDASRREAAQSALGADRLLHARDVGGAWSEEPLPHDPTVVRTTRSLLPIIQLKASGVATDEKRQAYAALIETSDPGDGDLFRRLREAGGVTEDEMQERTKVSIGYLRAIEANRFDRLPQAVYVKGFLRSYFRYLDVPDAERLVTAFSQRLAEWQASRKA